MRVCPPGLSAHTRPSMLPLDAGRQPPPRLVSRTPGTVTRRHHALPRMPVRADCCSTGKCRLTSFVQTFYLASELRFPLGWYLSTVSHIYIRKGSDFCIILLLPKIESVVQVNCREALYSPDRVKTLPHTLGSGSDHSSQPWYSVNFPAIPWYMY